MNFKNIIFDLDGTLLESMGVWEDVGGDFLRNHNIVPPDNAKEIFRDMAFEDSHMYFKTQYGLDVTFNEMIQEFITMVTHEYENNVPLKPFALDFLKQEKAKGTRMFILTASEKEYAIPALKRLEILDFFEEVYNCSNLKLNKRSTDVFNLVAEMANIKKEETTVFEDVLYAVENAKKAGFYVVGIEDFFAVDDKEKIKKASDLYITSFEEVCD